MLEYGPTWVDEIDRHAPVADLELDRRYQAVRLLVTAGGAPLGQVTVALHEGRADAASIRDALDAEFGHLADPQPPPTSVEPITVVVATRGRADSLARCVRSVLAGTHPAVTVLVIDNDPADRSTADAVQALDDARVRYVLEKRRGASVGRNRGLIEAATRVVAFTDDDTEVDPDWAIRVAGAFAADPELTCLSGPVLAARLGTEQERTADTAFAWNKGFVPRRFSLAQPPADSPIFPFSPGLFGIGANLAVVAEVARATGGFDEAMGPGTPTHGGEDCEFMVRLVLAGHAIGYVPGAYVWHHHRPTAAALREQMHGYAVGLGAFLCKVALDPGARAAALRRLPAALGQLRRITAREADAGAAAMPTGRRQARVRGLLTGPVALLRARRRTRRSGGRVPALTGPWSPLPAARLPARARRAVATDPALTHTR